MSERTSIESAITSGIETLQQIDQNYKRISAKENLARTLKTALKLLVEKGVLEERALRLLDIKYSQNEDKIERAFIENERFQDFLRSDFKELLKKWSDDLKSFATEHLAASGYEFSWLSHIDGMYFVLDTLNSSEKSILDKETVSEETVNKLPEVIREIHIRLLELGLDHQYIMTIKSEELYEITAIKILANYGSTFWLLRVSIEAKKTHEVQHSTAYRGAINVT